MSTETSVESAASLSLLDRMMVEGKMAREEGQRPYARDLLTEFVDQVLAETGDASAIDVVEAINQRIAQIDELISDQLNEVMHHPDFQKLEGTWRGLNYLVANTETSTTLKLRVLNVSRKDLQKDLDSAVEFDQSAMFKMVYEAEYGTLGGTPYSMLVGDYEFGRHPQDISLLEKMSNLAAAAHAPFISAVSPTMFDMESFSELGAPRDLSKIFETSEMVKWRSFRASEDSRYVSLTMPHVLMRLPYGPNTVPVEGMNFVEDTDGRDHSKYLWGNASWALAARITDSFAKHGWTAAIRGVEGGGKVEGLPSHTFKTDEGDVALKCPTEIAITDRREKELNDLGFISLVHCKNTDYAAFFSGQTTNKPKVYNTDEANANARISAMLPYMLVSSRFAHYLKVMLRDKIGAFLTRNNITDHLNTWIANYVLLDDEASQGTKARFPLREARIDVYDVPGRPGVYRANIFLRPHFQLEELSASIRMVAELPAPEA
ncbi:type VI secretion system contractile sheath large subunit [Azospirillum argentinense]